MIPDVLMILVSVNYPVDNLLGRLDLNQRVGVPVRSPT